MSIYRMTISGPLLMSVIYHLLDLAQLMMLSKSSVMEQPLNLKAKWLDPKHPHYYCTNVQILGG